MFLSLCYVCTGKIMQTIEFGMLPVERQFGQEEVDVIS